MNKTVVVLVCCLVVLMTTENAMSADFSPKLDAGKIIDSNNVQDYEQWLVEPLIEQITAGNYSIHIAKAFQFPVHPNYTSATDANRDVTKLGNKPGELIGYAGGQPFTKIDINDPQAGLKIAWNMRYAYSPDETETEVFNWQYRDMSEDTIERTLAMYGAILRYKHRHTNQPMPELENNPSDLYTALYLQVKSPHEIRNTQLLIRRNDIDWVPEQAWMYVSSQRRVRRLATGQKTDAFLGSDIMIEDFLGYNGRIMDMQWRLIGIKQLLTPVYAHNQLSNLQKGADSSGHQLIDFTGKGHCFPDISWQPREVYLLESVPVDPSHPLSKRLYLIDSASFIPVLGQIYDNAGKLWKLAIPAISHSGYHAKENLHWQGAITDGVSMIDLQAEHCTTLQLKSIVAQKPLHHRSFTAQYMRSQGR